MALHTRLQVYQKTLDYPVMPIFYTPDVEVGKRLLTACYEAGIRVCEFTNRGDFAHETYAELSKFAKRQFPELAFGAGTILDGPTAALYIQLGADFLVTPLLKHDVGVVCNRRKIGWMPGVFSPTEIAQAEEWGAEFVKIFPGNTLSPDFVKAFLAPSPWTNVVVTGGVEPTEPSMKTWFSAGAKCVGIGSALAPKNMIEAGDWTGITERISAALRVAQALRT